MIPAKGRQRYKPERESFMKSQILSLLDERDKYNYLKKNGALRAQKHSKKIPPFGRIENMLIDDCYNSDREGRLARAARKFSYSECENLHFCFKISPNHLKKHAGCC